MRPDIFLQLTDVCLKIKLQLVLKHIYFSIKPGERIALLGPNGAGKSTLLKVMAGLTPISTGKISYTPGLRHKMSIVLQACDYPCELTVAEVLQFVRAHFYKPLSIETINNQLQLDSILQQRIHTLSTGQKRTLALACALLNHPKILLLDEPTAGMDFVTRQRVWRLLTEKIKTGLTLFLISHDKNEINLLTQRILVLHAGEIFSEPNPNLIEQCYEEFTDGV